jgi:hypothetical protein
MSDDPKPTRKPDALTALRKSNEVARNIHRWATQQLDVAKKHRASEAHVEDLQQMQKAQAELFNSVGEIIKLIDGGAPAEKLPTDPTTPNPSDDNGASQTTTPSASKPAKPTECAAYARQQRYSRGSRYDPRRASHR